MSSPSEPTSSSVAAMTSRSGKTITSSSSSSNPSPSSSPGLDTSVYLSRTRSERHRRGQIIGEQYKIRYPTQDVKDADTDALCGRIFFPPQICVILCLYYFSIKGGNSFFLLHNGSRLNYFVVDKSVGEIIRRWKTKENAGLNNVTPIGSAFLYDEKRLKQNR